MRLAAILCGVLVLGGCNMITSPTPMFSAADVKGQAQLRPGVWTDDRKDCAFDQRQPLDAWPDCANGRIVRPDGVLGPAKGGAPIADWHLYPTLLVAGDPPILQVRADDKPNQPPMYVYLGLEVLKTDAQGRIAAYRQWPALCGPPPPDDANGPSNHGLTLQLIEGLTIDKDNANCVATTPAPIRVSAARSDAWRDKSDDGRDHAHWVRDGEK
jgi:hypothetical protein